MTDPGSGSPDPWAVVEYHARRAAVAGDAALGAGQRLALYVATAPDVIGARPMTSRERGIARSADVRWVVPSPDGTALLALDASGAVWVKTSSQTRQVLAAAAALVIATALFTRIAGPRAIIAGLIMAAGTYVLAGVTLSQWRQVGGHPGDERYQGMLAELAGRYERAAASAS